MFLQICPWHGAFGMRTPHVEIFSLGEVEVEESHTNVTECSVAAQ
jgi:hypothetical protein